MNPNLKLIFAICCIAIISICSTCEKDKTGHGDDRLTIKNNSNDSIFVVLQYNYPDTILSSEDYTHMAYNSIVIGDNMVREVWNSHNWENVISERNEYNTISIYVLSLDTVQLYSWENIREEYRILERFEINLEALKMGDWEVVYP